MDFRDLKVWNKAHQLTLQVYKLTKTFPKEETYRLSDQLRRAASSIPANIAEGTGRKTLKEYVQFLCNARGSVEEMNYHLILAKDLGYLSAETSGKLQEGYNETGRMLNGLIKSLRVRDNEL
jgi:four helix bundle protein